MDKDTAPLLIVSLQIGLELLRWWTRRKAFAVKTTTDTLMTLPQAAKRIGIPERYLRRLYERQLVGPALIVGKRRLVRESELPALREAAMEAGYLASRKRS